MRTLTPNQYAELEELDGAGDESNDFSYDPNEDEIVRTLNSLVTEGWVAIFWLTDFDDDGDLYSYENWHITPRGRVALRAHRAYLASVQL